MSQDRLSDPEAAPAEALNDCTWHPVAASDQLKEGLGQPFKFGAHRVAVVRHQGVIYALDDICPHADASIAFGPVENGCIACPWHFAEFRLETGEALSGPVAHGVRTYHVREHDGIIEICLEHERSPSGQAQEK